MFCLGTSGASLYLANPDNSYQKGPQTELLICGLHIRSFKPEVFFGGAKTDKPNISAPCAGVPIDRINYSFLKKIIGKKLCPKVTGVLCGDEFLTPRLRHNIGLFSKFVLLCDRFLISVFCFFGYSWED